MTATRHTRHAVRQRNGGWWHRMCGPVLVLEWRGRIRLPSNMVITGILVDDYTERGVP